MSKKYTDVHLVGHTKPRTAGKITTLIVAGLILLQMAIPSPKNSNSVPLVLASEARVTAPQVGDKEKIAELIRQAPDLSVQVTDDNYSDLLNRTKTFLAKYAVGTKVSAELIVNIAKENKFPLDLLLIQGHIESNWCTKGRATTSNMCINVGAYDRGDTIPTTCHDGTTWCVSDYAIGLQIYIDIMKGCWFKPNQAITIDNFIANDFRIQQRGDNRCGEVGARYATSPAYKTHFINATQNLFNPIFIGYQNN